MYILFDGPFKHLMQQTKNTYYVALWNDIID